MTPRAFVVVAATAFLVAITIPAFAVFIRSETVQSNAISTATLSPPTSPSATASCDGPGSAKIVLAWTATASSFADGYDAYRSATIGGPYTTIGHVSGRTSTTYSDPALSLGASYFYVVQTTGNNWTSVDSSEVQALTPSVCP